jgi:uncharacterized protein (TIGR03083 family)
MTDDELVAMLGMVWGSISDLGGPLTEAEWKTPTECPGWSVQDNLTHITAFEWRLLGRPDPEHAVAGDLPHVKNDIGKSNEVFVDSRRTWTGEAAVTEFDEVIAARLAQLRDAPPDYFAEETWTPAGPGQVRDLLPFRIFDSWVHEQDMRRAVGWPGDLDTPVAAAALERITGAMPFVVGKKAGAPDGATVAFALSGPLARTLAIGVDGGRAKPLAEVPPAPTATIATDTETFARLGTGRVAPEQALADGRVIVDGDVDLGRRVVENLNFLF